MSTNRKRSGLIHIKNKKVHKLSIEIATGKYFIRGTDIEVPQNRICRPEQNPKKLESKYNFDKPSHAQELDDEWDHYPWSADEF